MNRLERGRGRGRVDLLERESRSQVWIRADGGIDRGWSIRPRMTTFCVGTLRHSIRMAHGIQERPIICSYVLLHPKCDC